MNGNSFGDKPILEMVELAVVGIFALGRCKGILRCIWLFSWAFRRTFCRNSLPLEVVGITQSSYRTFLCFFGGTYAQIVFSYAWFHTS